MPTAKIMCVASVFLAYYHTFYTEHGFFFRLAYRERIYNKKKGGFLIAAIGIAVIDHIMVIRGFNNHEGSFQAESYHSEGGGMAATACCAASRLGSETRLITRVGDDINGQLIIEGLNKYHIDTSRITMMKNHHSTVSMVLVDQSTGNKQFYAEDVKPLYAETVELDENSIRDADVLLVDGHCMTEATQGVRLAKTLGIPVVADFKRRYENIETLFPYIDYFIIPSFFAHELTGKNTPEEMIDELRNIQSGLPVITDGSRGGYYPGSKSRTEQYRTFHIDTVDSTGAGDAFHGAFCHFLAKGLPLEHCLDLSSAVGALNCRAFGGREALPSIEELRSFLNKNVLQYDNI